MILICLGGLNWQDIHKFVKQYTSLSIKYETMVDVDCDNVYEKTRLELNERLESRRFDIEALRERMEARPDVYFDRKDDEFLLRFLRARKFDKDRAFNLLVNYCRFHRRHRNFFKSLRASCLRPVFEDGLPMVMPERDHLGRSVVILFPGNWNTNLYTFEDILRALLLTMEYLIESERTQICGVVFVVDFTGWRLSDTSHCNKSHLMDAVKVFQVMEILIILSSDVSIEVYIPPTLPEKKVTLK